MTDDANHQIYCSCEAVAHGELGIILPDELVARVVCGPRHIAKKDQSIKPGIFPPSHIATMGLSLMRTNYLSEEDLRKHADAIAAHDEKDSAVGVIECKVSLIRTLVEQDGLRSVCIFDDPVIGDPMVQDNPAHALLIAARELPLEDIAEIRDRLLRVFSGLRRFAA